MSISTPGKYVAAVLCAAALFLVAGSAYAADEPADATAQATAVVATNDPNVATVVSPLDVAFADLKRAFDRYALDAAFHDWANRVLACVQSSAKTTTLPTGTIEEARGTLRSLFDSCAKSLGVSLPSGDPGDSELGFGKPSTSGGAGSTTCGTNTGDPRLTQAGGTTDSSMIVPLKTAEQQKADVDAKKAKENADKAQAAADAAKAEANKLTDDNSTRESQQAAQYFAFVKQNHADGLKNEAARKQDEANRINNRPPGGDKQQTNPFAENGCAAAAAQLAECERNGWSTPDCSKIKSHLDGCTTGEVEVTDPSPVSEEDGSAPAESTCGPKALSAEELAAAILTACERLINYDPDGGSPCAPRVGGVLDATNEAWCHQHNDQTICVMGGDPCGSTEVDPLPDGEHCNGDVTFLELGPTAAEAIAAAITKLGGPIWTPPSTDPGPGPSPGGGPDGPQP